MNKISIIIPARYFSSRLRAKPLVLIKGKPLIVHVIERVQTARISEIIVATDHEDIKNAAESTGLCRVVLTSSNHSCGTDRIAEVTSGLDSDFILNVQGDQLISGPDVIDEILNTADFSIPIATLYTDIHNPDELTDVNTVKVLVNRDGRIIYMSRSPIPFDRGQYKEKINYYKQVGIYLFQRKALLDFAGIPATPLELIEGIELLRILDYGRPFGGIYSGRQLTDVDVPEDMETAREFIHKFPCSELGRNREVIS